MIKAIETVYNGYRFRSRLEARWAVFFDTLGIAYQYEPEGFDLGNGIWYLPDFWLPRQGCWIEIKGNSPTKTEDEKASALAKGTQHTVFIFFGGIPIPANQEELIQNNDSAHIYFPSGGGDNYYAWCECPKCGELGIEYDGRAARLCNCYPFSNKGYNVGSDKLTNAYLAARQARFEHGESK